MLRGSGFESCWAWIFSAFLFATAKVAWWSSLHLFVHFVAEIYEIHVFIISYDNFSSVTITATTFHPYSWLCKTSAFYGTCCSGSIFFLCHFFNFGDCETRRTRQCSNSKTTAKVIRFKLFCEKALNNLSLCVTRKDTPVCVQETLYLSKFSSFCLNENGIRENVLLFALLSFSYVKKIDFAREYKGPRCLNFRWDFALAFLCFQDNRTSYPASVIAMTKLNTTKKHGTG